jgi:hypothetical protein
MEHSGDLTALVAKHLRLLGILPDAGVADLTEADARVAGGETGDTGPGGSASSGHGGAAGADHWLPLGVPGISLGPDGLFAFGQPCQPEERRLTDLLSAGTGDGLFFASRSALEAAVRAGANPVLYHAYRDFLPPRELATGARLPAGGPGYQQARGPGYLFADLVVYQPGVLPGGEMFRSTGHWNLPRQLEIFQTLTGVVVMLVAGRRADGAPFLYEQECGPGEVMVVPPGVWHVSYVLDGPAAVFNVAADLGPAVGLNGAGQGTTRQSGAGPATERHADQDGTKPDTARQGSAKYRRADAVAATLSRDGRGYHRVISPDLGWPVEEDAPDTSWALPFVAKAGSLADLHLQGSPATLASLQDAALAAVEQGS